MTANDELLPCDCDVFAYADGTEYKRHRCKNTRAQPYTHAQVMALVEAARGLSFGEDWNNGTHAKIYRPKLLKALTPFTQQQE
jgi:hypothetical protein